MKNVRMLLTGAIVIAIVGGALAFKTPQRNLFQCNAAGFCVTAPYSDQIHNPILGNPSVLYKVPNSPDFDCPLESDPSIGCAIHPQAAWRND